MKKTGLFVLLIFLIILMIGQVARAEERDQNDITENCKFTICASSKKATNMTDTKYTSYWESKEIKDPFVTITSDQPICGLYLCFRSMPESYDIQTGGENKWRTVQTGDTRYYHVFYELDHVKQVRIQSTQAGKHALGFNEIFVFGPGEIPDWVQRWEDPPEKADLMFLMAHPDDELIFLGGAIPTYAVEKEKKVIVAYLSYSNTTRRSEALNGLWTMGVRQYPLFGGFRDCYGKNADASYKNVTGAKKTGQQKVWKWVTQIFRTYRPDVVVTHDINGEYGHGQHKMLADAVIQCLEKAADSDQFLEIEEDPWQIRKLYVHLYGDASNQTHMDWNIPLSKANGKTGLELACEAYALHVTQKGASIKIHGKKQYLSVEETGTTFPNTVFGLYYSDVGEDLSHQDFLENIPEQQE